MQFFVPACGTEFVLTEPWTFLLYVESRNESLFNAFGHYVTDLKWEEVDGYSGYGVSLPDSLREQISSNSGRHWRSTNKAAQISFMPGARLRVERVYIRNGQKGEYDSITLSVLETSHPFLLHAGKTKSGKKKKKLARFWVKLNDFNKIQGEITKENVRQHTT